MGAGLRWARFNFKCMTSPTTKQFIVNLESLRQKGTPAEKDALDALTGRLIRLSELTDRLIERFDRVRLAAAAHSNN